MSNAYIQDCNLLLNVIYIRTNISNNVDIKCGNAAKYMVPTEERNVKTAIFKMNPICSPFVEKLVRTMTRITNI